MLRRSTCRDRTGRGASNTNLKYQGRSEILRRYLRRRGMIKYGYRIAYGQAGRPANPGRGDRVNAGSALAVFFLNCHFCRSQVFPPSAHPPPPSCGNACVSISRTNAGTRSMLLSVFTEDLDSPDVIFLAVNPSGLRFGNVKFVSKLSPSS